MSKEKTFKNGDKIRIPERPDEIFTVEKVRSQVVQVRDFKSTAGYTIVDKSYAVKVSGENYKKPKFNTIGEIVEQLEWCDYENEAGKLENNVAFKALKKMANGHT